VSGIYGIVRFDGGPVTKETLAPISEKISFWGPDGHGQWSDGPAGLGHLMLHVTPESLHEKLPVTVASAPHLVITADARIDNRDELFDALEIPAPRRQQIPDGEVILAAYERWGSGCVRRLLGDFAFAIWNRKDRTLFCARDVFGCKPFVYHHDARRFVFASDIRGVLPALATPVLNEPLLAAYLQMKTYHAEKRYTFFRDILKLPPAHTLAVCDGQVRLARYWSAEDAAEIRLATDEDYEEQMRTLFAESVRCRLRSAFPIGSHLSGGLDSSSVTVMAARTLRECGQRLATYSWSPAPAASSFGPDSEYARIDAVCRAEELTCEFIPTTKESLIQSFQRNITVEPVEMMAREATVQSSAAKRGLRVMLSGWGGDEGVSIRTSDFLPDLLRRGRWFEFTRIATSQIRNRETGRDAFRSAIGIARAVAVPHLPDRLYNLVLPRSQMMHQAVCIHPAFRRKYRAEVRELSGPLWRHLASMRATVQRRFEVGHIVKRIEHWAASGVRHTLEYRYPMLDRRLVEFILGVPAERHRDVECTAPLFARVAGSFLPPEAIGIHVKGEHLTVDALRKECFAAYLQWCEHLLKGGKAAGSQFIDQGRLLPAIYEGARSQRIAALTGLQEAFLVVAIRR
jgi:asparagine synthase (glutamine-hydrolysing)